MQLVIKGGLVVADHPDTDRVDLASYGEGARVVPYFGLLDTLPRVGALPYDPATADARYDTRPHAAPTVDPVQYAGLRRWYVETGGVVVAGARIATDEGSQAKIGNAYALQQASGTPTVQFKSESGWITLTADQLKALAIAVGGHVQACYAKESEIDAAITAGTIKTLDDIDAAFAPLAA